jgi:hypothetical protein
MKTESEFNTLNNYVKDLVKRKIEMEWKLAKAGFDFKLLDAIKMTDIIDIMDEKRLGQQSLYELLNSSETKELIVSRLSNSESITFWVKTFGESYNKTKEEIERTLNTKTNIVQRIYRRFKTRKR